MSMVSAQMMSMEFMMPVGFGIMMSVGSGVSARIAVYGARVA